MPLRLDLKPHEKLFVGGAVLVNGDSRSTLSVLNDVPILREKDIMTEAEANTPCKRIYLSIQLMYMEPAKLADFHQLYWTLAKEVIAAAPSTSEMIAAISEDVLSGHYYQGLKRTTELIKYEKELVAHASQPA
jgi:flagellar biosynthesis repressor protein FlbT